MSNDLLVLSDIVVSFDGFRVLDDLSISIARGELRFLIGPHGAGKTTLMDVISGKVRAVSGKAVFNDGLDLTKLSEDRIVRAGIGRKFQTPSVFGSLTCFENVEVASGVRESIFKFFAPPNRAMRDRVFAALERVGLEERSAILASQLSHGERQWLEIAMLLVRDPKLILLDEPVAGMTGRERERTGDLLHALEGSHSLIVTEHDMDFVRQFSRKVTVLHMGKLLAEGTGDLIQRDARVQEVYTGRAKAPLEIAGIAWAGTRGVSAVELSFDGEHTWQPAQIEAATNELSWRRWRLTAALPAGRRIIAVRAIDGEGMIQDAEPRFPHPSGATGYHRIKVTART